MRLNRKEIRKVILEEGESVSSKLPTVQEFKSVLKELQKLEKMH
mgnify:FL=1|tara:strand:+ start:766 stop:897 length:132 start_codon:yes stop_codon:yes gene_type:complete